MTEDIVDASRLEEAQQFIQEEEGPRRQLEGSVATLASVLAAGMSLLFFYWAWATVTAQALRLMFLGCSLVLSFLFYPARRRTGDGHVPWYDWLLVGASVSPADRESLATLSRKIHRQTKIVSVEPAGSPPSKLADKRVLAGDETAMMLALSSLISGESESDIEGRRR